MASCYFTRSGTKRFGDGIRLGEFRVFADPLFRLLIVV